MPIIDQQGEASPDFTEAWVVGHEYVSQEGTSFFRKLREEAGYTRENIADMTAGLAFLPPPAQELFEDWLDLPNLEQLIALAVVYDTSPGELIDRCFREKGAQLLAERADDEQTSP